MIEFTAYLWNFILKSLSSTGLRVALMANQTYRTKYYQSSSHFWF
jgi:hypothetical protein